MSGFFVATYLHPTSPRDNAQTAKQIARLLRRPVLGKLSRMYLQVGDRDLGHKPVTESELIEDLTGPGPHAIALDNGRGTLEAIAAIQLALPFSSGLDTSSPLVSFVVVPYVEAERTSLIDTAVELAEALRPVWGMMSVEPTVAIAHKAALHMGPQKDERARYPQMTDDRVRYRRVPFVYDTKIDHAIGGPEWGTLLGSKHLARVSLEALRSSGAFAEVRELASGGAFLALSANPGDALSDKIVELVAAGRRALDPIVLDVSAVKPS